MPDFKSQFPRWEPQSLDLILPRTLSDQGKDLFKRLLIYDPAKRLTAKGALDHPYFADMKTNRDQAASASAGVAKLEQLA